MNMAMNNVSNAIISLILAIDENWETLYDIY